tara:strand:+ start:1164 stop:1337 length:174 start_codon:yes stop_codon:yes gene_type:complete
MSEEQLKELIRLCTDKIDEQKNHEATVGYGEDYTDGRIVGQAALARRILLILNRRWY